MSKEDEEEQAQAKINLANDAKLAKNEESLKDAITAEEKHKEDLDAAHRDGSSEEMQPTIKKAESERAKMEKKEEKKTKKFKDDNTKEQIAEAKAIDGDINKEYKFESAKASLKVYKKPAALVQKSKPNLKAKLFDKALTKSGFDEKAKVAAPALKKLSVAEITKMVIEKAKKQKLAQAEPTVSKED